MRSLGSSIVACLLWTFGEALAAPGDVDPTFGSGGVSAIALADSPFMVDALLLPDASLVAVVNRTSGEPALVRWSSNGTPDATFGTAGVASLAVAGRQVSSRRLLRQSNGRLVVVAASRTGTGSLVTTLLGVLDDGTFDPAFGSGGVVLGTGWAEDGALLADDRILVATDVGLSRFAADGAIDATFGSGGSVALDLRGQPRVAIDAVGRIVVVREDNGQLPVTRYAADGNPDAGFGVGGVRRILPAASLAPPPHGVSPSELALDAAGRILVAAGNGSRGLAAMVARLGPDGAVDTGFGAAGVAVITMPGDFVGPPRLAVEPDGALVAQGSVGLDDDTSRRYRARLRADGLLDQRFGAAGRTLDTGPGSAIARRTDGRIVAAGRAPGGVAATRILTDCASLPDADGDGSGDACDPCTAGSETPKGKLTLKGNFTLVTGGDARLTWRGKAPSDLVGFDALASGAVFLVEDATGRVVQSTWLYGGPVDPETRIGWKVSGTRAIYKDPGRSRPRLDGVAMVGVKRSSGGTASITVKTNGGRYAVDPNRLPLRASLILTPPRGVGGGCVTSSFPAGCVLSVTQGALTCR